MSSLDGRRLIHTPLRHITSYTPSIKIEILEIYQRLIGGGQVPDFDLFTYSFPCQSISNSGLQHGFKEGSGTRSSLLWECRKAIAAKHPKYLLMENVKALVSKKFIQDFNTWLLELEGYGYVNFWQVLNATDYGVPQNRERVFCVSILRTDENNVPTFHFPHPSQLDKRLKDVIEKSEDGSPMQVDEKYYLSDKALDVVCENYKGAIL